MKMKIKKNENEKGVLKRRKENLKGKVTHTVKEIREIKGGMEVLTIKQGFEQ